MGILDLAAPLLNFVDRIMALPVPIPAARIALYGALSGLLCMAIYRHFSRQSELAELAGRTRQLRSDLASYDGPFNGLIERSRNLLGLNGRHLRLSFLPAIGAGLPILLVLPWMSNQFGVSQPTPGATIEIHAEGLEVPIEQLRWLPPALTKEKEPSRWTITWPDAGQHVQLNHGEERIVRLPTEIPANVIHQRVPVWNHLIGNPAGYLDESAPLFAIRMDLPRQELLPWGPAWLRGWLAIYLTVLVVASLLLKWRWKLH